jgi:hypothetical protein
MKNKLTIDLEYLLFAWQDEAPQSAYYLDTETGSVVLIQRDLDEVDELRREIEVGGDRFVYLPKPDREQIELDLGDFIYTSSDAKLKAMLEVALESRDKIGTCKTLLSRYPEELKRWQEWRRKASLERVKKWLAAHDLEMN